MTDSIIVIKTSELSKLVTAAVKAALPSRIIEDRALEVPEVADRLKVSEATVLRRLRTKVLRGRRLGRKWHIMESAVNEYERGE